jgi:hypothetical protein
VKALSVRQPWAWAILHAGKDIENREWRGTNGFRGLFLLHASQRPNPTRLQDEGLAFVDFCRERRIRLPDGEKPGVLSLGDLFRDCGGIVGVARVVDIRQNGDAPTSPWAIPGLLGLQLTDVHPLPFVPCKGALGFWSVPDAVIDELERLTGGRLAS